MSQSCEATATIHAPCWTLGAGATAEGGAGGAGNRRSGFHVLVAETAGDLIGFAMALPSKGELRAIYVKLVGWVKAMRNQSDVAEPR